MISLQTEVNKSSQIHLIHLILEAIFQGEGYISIHAKNSGAGANFFTFNGYLLAFRDCLSPENIQHTFTFFSKDTFTFFSKDMKQTSCSELNLYLETKQANSIFSLYQSIK